MRTSTIHTTEAQASASSFVITWPRGTKSRSPCGPRAICIIQPQITSGDAKSFITRGHCSLEVFKELMFILEGECEDMLVSISYRWMLAWSAGWRKWNRLDPGAPKVLTCFSYVTSIETSEKLSEIGGHIVKQCGLTVDFCSSHADSTYGWHLKQKFPL